MRWLNKTTKSQHLRTKPNMAKNAFNYDLDFDQTDFRKHPELYRIGVGEQGVLLVQPYKVEILPFWKFKTEKNARESAEKIYALFLEYLKSEDFVGADMAGNSCKWPLRGPGATPTIKADASINLARKIRRKAWNTRIRRAAKTSAIPS
jgi:hypothetical protein